MSSDVRNIIIAALIGAGLAVATAFAAVAILLQGTKMIQLWFNNKCYGIYDGNLSFALDMLNDDSQSGFNLDNPYTIDVKQGGQVWISQTKGNMRKPSRTWKPGDVVKVRFNDSAYSHDYTYVRGVHGWFTERGILNDQWMREQFNAGRAWDCVVSKVQWYNIVNPLREAKHYAIPKPCSATIHVCKASQNCQALAERNTEGQEVTCPCTS